MADETQGDTLQAKETVTKVTDTDLASEWDKAQTTEEQTEETKEETTETKETEETQEETKTEQETTEETQEQTEEELPEEPKDNAERSRLGRRLKSIEEKFESFLNEIKQTTNPQSPKIPDNVTYDENFIQSQLDAAVERGEIPGTIITPQDQIKVNVFISRLHNDISNQYSTGYINALKSTSLKGNTPDDIHAEVITELQKYDSPFNRRLYDNPTVDARMNYAEAKSHILQKRLSEGKTTTVFKGKPKGVPTGTSVNTKMATVKNDLPELDEASRDFIKRTGMSVDSVKAALNKDLPIYFKGKF